MAGKYDNTRGYTILYRYIRGLPKKNENTIILDNKLLTIHIYYNKTRVFRENGGKTALLRALLGTHPLPVMRRLPLPVT